MNMPGAEDDAGERPLETKENGNVNTDEKELGQDLSDKVSSQEDAAQDENEAAELDPVSSDKVSGEEEMDTPLVQGRTSVEVVEAPEEIARFEEKMLPLENAALKERRGKAFKLKLLLQLPEGHTHTSDEFIFETFKEELVCHAKRQIKKELGASSRAAAGVATWKLGGNVMKDWDSFEQLGLENEAKIHVHSATKSEIQKAETEVRETQDYVHARVNIRHAVTLSIMVLCFLSAAILAGGRAAMPFHDGDTGWKSFVCALVLTVVGTLAGVVYCKSGDLQNYFAAPEEQDDHDDHRTKRLLADTNLVLWSTWLARLVLVAYVVWMGFSIFAIASIPQEIDTACGQLDPCQYRNYQTSTIAICSVLAILSFPILFMLLLGPCADVALGVGRIRSRLGILMKEVQLHADVQRSEEDYQVEAQNVDAWIIHVQVTYDRVHKSYVRAVEYCFSPCTAMAKFMKHNPATTVATALILGLAGVAWPFGVSLLPIPVVFIPMGICIQVGLTRSQVRSDQASYAAYATALVVGCGFIGWFIFYAMVLWPMFCPEAFGNVPCAVSSVLFMIVRVVAFLACVFSDTHSGACFF